MTLTKKLLAASAMSLCLIGAAPPEPVFNAPADVAAIKAVEDFLATELDIDKVITAYADDAVVLDIYAPGVFKGRKAIYDGFGPQLARIKALNSKTPEMTIATNGNFGCAAMQIAFETTLKDGTQFKMNLRQLDALKKIDGKWKVVQQHISLPLDPKTLNAVLDAPIQPRAITWSEKPLADPSVTQEKGNAEIRAFMDVGGASQGLDMLMGYYGPTDDLLVYDSLHPKALIGMKEVRDYYASIMGSYKGIKLSMPNFTVDNDGSFGVQIDTQDLTLTMNDGSTRNISLRQSDCMRRLNGKWYSFFEMISYPVDMKTNKGIMEGPGATR
ncbi:YybH family protein [Sphingobium aromaticiconvertens]|uniref:YybH family protein n=1 Tax=Sphingobium aromaticiconvertens TaxID=365341 RepID=UPI00301AD743